MAEKVLMKGNEAIAEAAIRCGCLHYFGYPITPQTEVAAYMAKRMPKVGGTFLQAESEVAAINMVIGVSSTGNRVMTSSSSPGVSLKSEGISYLAGCDLPALVVNVQRGGPGLGGIQPSQSDYFQSCYQKSDGIVINPGAYTHTSVALLDALKAVSIPSVEVHISDVPSREDFRQISYIRPACKKTIIGHGIAGYVEAIEFLQKFITESKEK